MSAFKFQWIPHKGGPMPVSGKTLVALRFADAIEVLTQADCFRWTRAGLDDDIIAYRVKEVR